MDKLGRLIEQVEHALSELVDSKSQIAELEELFSGFVRYQKHSRILEDEQRTALEREIKAANQIRIHAANTEILGRKAARAWKRALQIACAEMTDEEKVLDSRLSELGWYDNTPKFERELK
jgi:hypothetical protein